MHGSPIGVSLDKFANQPCTSESAHKVLVHQRRGAEVQECPQIDITVQTDLNNEDKLQTILLYIVGRGYFLLCEGSFLRPALNSSAVALVMNDKSKC